MYSSILKSIGFSLFSMFTSTVIHQSIVLAQSSGLGVAEDYASHEIPIKLDKDVWNKDIFGYLPGLYDLEQDEADAYCKQEVYSRIGLQGGSFKHQYTGVRYFFNQVSRPHVWAHRENGFCVVNKEWYHS